MDEKPDEDRTELAPLGCLGAGLAVGGWALVWLLAQAWHGVRWLLGW